MKRESKTEQRRHDTASQKAIRAYWWLKENGATQEEAAIRFGISNSEISRAKKVESSCGSETLEKLYRDGYIYLANKKHTRLRTILDLFKEKKEVQHKQEYNDAVKQILDLCIALKLEGDLVSLAQVKVNLNKMIQEID